MRNAWLAGVAQAVSPLNECLVSMEAASYKICMDIVVYTYILHV